MHCLIVDDDPLICDLLKHYCEKTDIVNAVTTTTSGFESINLINNNYFDCIFLDYNLPDITGKEILEVVNNSPVIMITSNKAFASESYDYDQIIDFLVKPVKYPRFLKALSKVQETQSKRRPDSDKLFLKDGNRLVKVNLEKVKFFKSEANYISVNMTDKKFLTLMTIKELIGKLPGYFMRVHRSYIINLNLIDEISQNTIKSGEDYIPVSDSYEKELLRQINML